jgi:hypothetical protein
MLAHTSVIFETLGEAGLLRLSSGRSGSLQFEVTPRGYSYYAAMKQRSSQPSNNVEETIRSHLVSVEFQAAYSEAYRKWSDAEEKLWTSDSEDQLTTIGHLCRGALQEFADALAERQRLGLEFGDKARTVARIRAVLEQRKQGIGATEQAFLDALLVYWGTVSDLVQRQEHGGQREKGELMWEDARRVVFQSMIVMFGIDRAIRLP